MENVFRTKKYRDTTLRAKTHDVVSGTLDSIHQSFVLSLFDKNKEELESRRKVIVEKLKVSSVI